MLHFKLAIRKGTNMGDASVLPPMCKLVWVYRTSQRFTPLIQWFYYSTLLFIILSTVCTCVYLWWISTLAHSCKFESSLDNLACW